MSKLMGFVYPGVVEILNIDSFGPLKSYRGGYTLVMLIH
jgi:hypothetical protein